MNYIQRFISLFQKPLSAGDFRKCVFSHLKRNIAKQEPVQEELQEMQAIINAGFSGNATENRFARMYLKLEQYAEKEQADNRISREKLRGIISRSCRVESSKGDFALLFLPGHLRRIKLFERFTGEILKKSQSVLGEERFRKILSLFTEENRLRGVIKKNEVDWSLFSQKFQEFLPVSEKREEAIKKFLGQVLSKVLNNLSEVLESIRAELIFKDAYKQFRERMDFLDDALQVLLILPEDILQEERVEIMSKSKLIDELRRRNQELEFTLAQLSEEKRKLDDEKQKLVGALANLQVVDRAKSDFITVVSHQFRTPLSAIRWNNEILTEEILKLGTEKSKDLLNYTKIANDKIVFLVNVLEDVYDVLAIEGKTATLEKKPGQLWEIVEDVLAKFKDETDAKNLELKFERFAAPLKEIQVDKQKIRRVCEMLIRNAVQYTPPGGKVMISIREIVYRDKPALSCIIQDTGIGIAAEDENKLFAKFFRGKNAVNMVPDGAGLGLYLVRYFVEAHGEAIKLESELGKGSTFTFILPVA